MFLFAFVIFFYLGPGLLAANSLWSDDAADIYADHKASSEGDLVTILIVEAQEAQEEVATDSGKSSSTGFSLGNLLSAVKDIFTLEDSAGLPDVEIRGEEQFDASGSTARSGSFQARITAEVKEVLSSGNLRVKGEKTLAINEEEQKIVISGIVRPEDIATDNTVYSTRIADVKIGYTGEGVLSDKQEPGILSRLFDWLI